METIEAKPGWKTTEFWLTVLSNLVTLTGVLKDLIPPEKAAMIIAVINGIYGIVRAFTKSNTPVITTTTAAPSVTTTTVAK